MAKHCETIKSHLKIVENHDIEMFKVFRQHICFYGGGQFSKSKPRGGQLETSPQLLRKVREHFGGIL